MNAIGLTDNEVLTDNENDLYRRMLTIQTAELKRVTGKQVADDGDEEHITRIVKYIDFLTKYCE